MLDRSFVKRHTATSVVPLRVSDIHAKTVPKNRSYWNYQELFYKYEGIRIIFLVHTDTLLPNSVSLPSASIFQDEETLINVYDWIAVNVPKAQFVIVAYGGAVNPNGNTKIKTIKCAPRKPK
jgi:hypothetical protein